MMLFGQQKKFRIYKRCHSSPIQSFNWTDTFVADSLSSKENSVLMCLQKYNCFGLLWFLEAGGGNMEEIKGEMPYGAQGESQCEGVVFEKE